ncbi:enoyl-CoA hydratase/isomerase family protein [Microbacterium maritypicum]|uniref:Enoyl-CoA hydratase n=1 Tax=Microbacterium maritypicum MF109 TaxID=1333857 RepID=T5L491_MICMQ|nr:enoyl-CoA hydratase/isomerase family protein [Microbacterium liquefaciens]EQM87099.1 hypothetical protein L687_00065 [Microbacterium maritypicum MF109]
MSTLLISSEGTTLTVTLDRPAQLNAMGIDELDAIRHVFTQLAETVPADRHRAVVVRSTGTRAFVAGADIAEMAAASSDSGERISRAGQAAMDSIAACPVPVIAAVDGHALGGGCELAAACDLVYATANSLFALPEVGLGLIPCFGGTYRVAARIGDGRARRMALTGERVTAATAEEWGLIDAVLPDADGLAAAVDGQALAFSRASRSALAAVKAAFALPAPLRAVAERTLFRDALAHADGQEGMAAFLSKRAPSFR